MNLDIQSLKDLIQEWHIDPLVLIFVVAAGFFQNTYLRYWLPFKKLDSRYNASIRTLLVSAVFTVVYASILRLNHVWTAPPGTYCLSYTVATSFYEVLLYPLVVKKIQSITHTDVIDTDNATIKSETTIIEKPKDQA